MLCHCRTPLAWKNLMYDRRRLVVAGCGMGFAVLLMFMQTGLRHALFDSSVQLLQRLNADVIVVSRAQYALPAQRQFPRARMIQARNCLGVQAAYPLYLETVRGSWWPGPKQKAYPIRVVAFDLGDPVFLPGELPEVADRLEQLRQAGTALADVRSKAIYHLPPADAAPDKPADLALASRRVHLVGRFSLGTDFAVDGNVIMSTASFAHFFPDRGAGDGPLEPVDLGLVLAQPGVAPEELCERLRQVLPTDVLVCTKRDFLAREINFWKTSTPTGFIFTLGAVIGFVVGTIICSQIVNADISDHLAEFATLKAMGYRDRYFLGFVLQEALCLSLLGFVPGLLVSCALYQGLAWYTGLVFLVQWDRVLLVLGLTVTMCAISGGLAIRRVLSADPAELF